jgi:RND family efflux transporter MFP subunit
MKLARWHLGGWAVVLGLLAGCTTRPARPKLGEVERLPSLETIYPRYVRDPIKVDLLATVEPFEKADLYSQVQGEVRDLAEQMDIDRSVRKGETLVQLYIPALQAERESKDALRKQARDLKAQAEKTKEVAAREVTEARAQIARYKADLDFRELALRRTRELVAKGTLQPQLQEEAELQRNSARAALEAARALALTKEARLEAARAEVQVAASKIEVAEADYRLLDAKVRYAEIKAPFDGVITRRLVDNGATIKDTSTPLFTVVRSDKVRVLVDVPERYVPLIRADQGGSGRGDGNRVRLHFAAFGQEWKPEGGPARITRVAPSLDATTRLLRAEVHVKNDGYLRPGMTGRATVILDDGKTERLTIPSTALVRVGNQMKVYYIADPHGQPLRGQVKAAVVTLGLDNGKTVEIKSGLTSKELVIAKGNGVLPEGTAIAVDLRETKH